MTRRRDATAGAVKGDSPLLSQRMEHEPPRDTPAARLEKYAWSSPGGSSGPGNIKNAKTGRQAGGRKKDMVDEDGSERRGGEQGCGSAQFVQPGSLQPGGEQVWENEPTLKEIMAAIKQCTLSVGGLTDQMQGMRVEVSLLRQDVQKIRERTIDLENRVSDVEDKLSPLQSEVRKLSQRMEGQAQKIDDFENRLRRNNLRLVGFPEKAEGNNPIEFVEKWLTEIVGKEYLSPYFAVERAHRVPVRTMPPGNAPRSILIRLLNYRDKENILRRIRNMQEVQYNGCKIMLFPDYSPEIQRKRSSFQGVKKRLQGLQLQYAMLYPAKIRIQAEDAVFFFETSEAVTDWLDRHYIKE